MIKRVSNILLRILMYPAPKLILSSQEMQIFEHLFESSRTTPENMIQYNYSIPKYKFLYYLSQNKNVILHGSNNKFIRNFEPSVQTLFNGIKTKAVFATKDPIWSIFYAVFRRESLVDNFRNGCITVNGKQKFHFYSLTDETFRNQPWTDGMVYIVPEKSFRHVGKGVIVFDEWISKDPVFPIAKLEVGPDDFYFLEKVARHSANESIAKSWMLYKLRIFLRNKKN